MDPWPRNLLIVLALSCWGGFCHSASQNNVFKMSQERFLNRPDQEKQGKFSVFDYPFQDPTLSWSDRVDDLVGRLTLEELVPQSMAIYGQPVPAIDRLGIKPYVWITECLRGQVNTNTTAFPQSIGLAAAFSEDLVFQMSEAVSYEIRAHWNSNVQQGKYETDIGLSCFSPVINIMRHPLWGRNQETYGEDPYLSSVLASSYVNGLQGDHPRYVRANAGCKHFDAYAGPENIPSSRFSFNAKVSMRDLRMTFLPAFKSCVDAGTYSIMCSYNAVNGVPACASKELLTDILRTEWHFHGYVISDDLAIKYIKDGHHYTNSTVDTLAAAISAGCNIELAEPKSAFYKEAKTAIQQKKITEAQFRESMKPLFYTRMRLGEFDPVVMNPYNNISMSVVQSPEHRDLALTAAIKTFVLLKNKDNLLPLKTHFKQIAIVGPMADNVEQQYGDYGSQVNSQYASTPHQSLAKLADKSTYAAGCDDNKCVNYNEKDIQLAVAEANITIVCLGTGQQVESEGNDRSTIDLPGRQLDLLRDAAYYSQTGTPIIVLLFNAGPLDITWAKLDERVSAIIECFFPAQSTGEALFRALTAQGNGDIPGGRLQATWPAYENQVASITNYTMAGRTYRYYTETPLYPFGYGLSYSNFIYTNLSVYPASVPAGKSTMLSATVVNSGPYDADEVVQFYMSWGDSTLPAPRYQLVGFQRVFLKRDQAIEVSTEVTSQQMQLWMDDNTGFVVPKGLMAVYAGGQQPNQRTSVPSNILSASFTVV